MSRGKRPDFRVLKWHNAREFSGRPDTRFSFTVLDTDRWPSLATLATLGSPHSCSVLFPSRSTDSREREKKTNQCSKKIFLRLTDFFYFDFILFFFVQR